MLFFVRRWLSSLFPPDADITPLQAADPDAQPQVLSADTAAQAEVRPAAGTQTGESASAAPAEEDIPAGLMWWIPREAPAAAPDPSQAGRKIDRSLYDQLARVIDDPGLELPHMPQVAQRALHALRGDDANYRKVAELVEQDQVLAAEILRVANSVSYRGLREIRQLDLAFARLGLRTLRSVILGATLKGLSIRTGGDHKTLGEELYQRSFAAGVVLRHLAPRFKLPEDESFLVGLLHDIGMLVILKVANEYQQYHGRTVDRPLFDRLCTDWHQHVGMRLADAWNLPDPLPELIGTHHKDPADDDPLKTYRLLIMTSDAASALLGYAPYEPLDFFNLPCVQRLGLADDLPTRKLLADIPGLLAERLEAV